MIIRKAIAADVPAIRSIAYTSWPVTYAFLEKEHVDYMLNEFYAPEVLLRLISSGEQEFLMLEEEKEIGFAAFSQREAKPGVYKLNKLYLLPDQKGFGFGRMLLEKAEDEIRSKQGKVLELNVNRYNPSLDFYRHLGYEIAYEEDIPVGPYWMNDYVMRKDLEKMRKYNV